MGTLIGNIQHEGEKLEVELGEEIIIYLLVNHIEVTLEAKEMNLLGKHKMKPKAKNLDKAKPCFLFSVTGLKG